MRKEFGAKGKFGSARKVPPAFRLMSNKEDFPDSLSARFQKPQRNVIEQLS